MHTIKVNVHKCHKCKFLNDGGMDLRSCDLADAVGLPHEVWRPDREEAPDWCPARDGVQIEKEEQDG